MWIENIFEGNISVQMSLWFEKILKWNINILTKNLFVAISFYHNIFLLQYCLQKLLVWWEPKRPLLLQPTASKKMAVITRVKPMSPRVGYLARSGSPGNPMPKPHPRTSSQRCLVPITIAEIRVGPRTHPGVTLWTQLSAGNTVTFLNAVSQLEN